MGNLSFSEADNMLVPDVILSCKPMVMLLRCAALFTLTRNPEAVLKAVWAALL